MIYIETTPYRDVAIVLLLYYTECSKNMKNHNFIITLEIFLNFYFYIFILKHLSQHSLSMRLVVNIINNNKTIKTILFIDTFFNAFAIILEHTV